MYTLEQKTQQIFILRAKQTLYFLRFRVNLLQNRMRCIYYIHLWGPEPHQGRISNFELGIIWEPFHEPDNVPKWFLITKNLRVETKIMSLVWTEPKLQFHSMRSWASHFCSWHPDHGLWHQSHIYSMFRSWQPQVRISLLEVLLASYSPSTLFLTFWSIWGC